MVGMNRPPKLVRLATLRNALRSAIEGMDRDIDQAVRDAEDERFDLNERLRRQEFRPDSQPHRDRVANIDARVAAITEARERRSIVSADLQKIGHTVDTLDAWLKDAGHGLRGTEVRA